MKKWIVAGVVAAIVVLVGALGVGTSLVLAQGPTGGPTPAPFGFGPMMGWGLRGGFGYGSTWYAQIQSAVAKALGISVDELTAQLQSGKTIAQIAQSKNISLTKLHDDVQAAQQALIQQAVKDGQLTQAQADWMLQRMNAIDDYMDQYLANGGTCPGLSGAGFGGLGMMGARRGRGMMGGFWGPGGFGPSATPTPNK